MLDVDIKRKILNGKLPPKQLKLLIELFNTVKIAGLSIEWANRVDICPDELYNNSTKKKQWNTITSFNKNYA